MAPTKFQETVYAAISNIPKGKVTTYALLAKHLGCNSPQAVGQALKCNPFAPIVPCHRVIASTGLVGGFKGARTGQPIQEKITLLKSEGITINQGTIDLLEFGFSFENQQ